MIGPQLRKALRWATIAWLLLNAVQLVSMFVDEATRSGEATAHHWSAWLHALGALLSPMIFAGTLWALLSIDERLERKA